MSSKLHWKTEYLAISARSTLERFQTFVQIIKIKIFFKKRKILNKLKLNFFNSNKLGLQQHILRPKVLWLNEWSKDHQLINWHSILVQKIVEKDFWNIARRVYHPIILILREIYLLLESGDMAIPICFR